MEERYIVEVLALFVERVCNTWETATPEQLEAMTEVARLLLDGDYLSK